MNAATKDKFNKANKLLNRMMPILTPLAVAIGLVLGNRISWMKPGVTYLFACMTFLGTMKISIKEIGDTLKKPAFLIAFALGSYIIMPLIAELAGLAFSFGDKDLISGYNLMRAIPTGVVCTIWTMILSGNLAASISILMLDTLLAPFLTPLLLRIFTGEAIAIDSIGMMKSLLFMVLIPSVLGLIFNHFCKNFIDEDLGPISNPLSKLLLVMVIAINTSNVANKIIENLSFSYIFIALGSLALAIVGFPIGYLLSKLFHLDPTKSVSVTMTIALRNVSAALVLAITYLPSSAALPVIFSIIFQQSICAFMGNWLFGHTQKTDSIAK